MTNTQQTPWTYVSQTKTTDVSTVSAHYTKGEIETIIAQRLHETETRIMRTRDAKGDRKDRAAGRQGHYYTAVEFAFAIILITHANLPVWMLVGLTVPDLVQWTCVDLMRGLRWVKSWVNRGIDQAVNGMCHTDEKVTPKESVRDRLKDGMNKGYGPGWQL